MVSTRACGALSSGSNPDRHTCNSKRRLNAVFYFTQCDYSGFEQGKGSGD